MISRWSNSIGIFSSVVFFKLLIIVSSVKQLYNFTYLFQKVARLFSISIVISVSVIPKTLNGLIHLFFSWKIQTLLPKFKANGSVCIVSKLL